MKIDPQQTSRSTVRTRTLAFWDPYRKWTNQKQEKAMRLEIIPT